MTKLVASLLCTLGLTLPVFAGKQVIRAAFDIGSNSTKMVVAEVDTEENKVIKVLFPTKDKEGRIDVDYRNVLTKKPTDDQIRAITADGAKAILELKKQAERFKPNEWVGVATSAFRVSVGLGKSVVKVLEERTGIRIHIVTTEEESELGLLAVSTICKDPAENIVVWDIGSSSAEFCCLRSKAGTRERECFCQKCPFGGSMSFVDYLVNTFEKKNGSPNPMSPKEIAEASKMIAERCKLVDPSIREKIQSKGVKVIGIGGVHYHSLRDQVMSKGDDYYDQNMVRKALTRMESKTDEAIGGKYSKSQVSNLVLVLSVMQELKIERVTPMHVNLAHGVLISPSRWKK